ncbi:DUF6193 family natural product biosynthesis protein [Streptomyces sp. NPDC005813]|uniref:DUF6193 family natural product biosynthesis protein n=1 Tax=Streptomyces sp. NPDC005813 TaxID=3155592 RepID=UPI0033F227C1
MDAGSETDDSIKAAWDFRARAAEAWDERSRSSTTTWVPPILAALVHRARNSALGRFYPYTSHAALAFSTGPRHWLGEGEVLPVAIELVPEGLYVVRTRSAGMALETASADEAVTEAERLVERLTDDGQASTRGVSGGPETLLTAARQGGAQLAKPACGGRHQRLTFREAPWHRMHIPGQGRTREQAE